MIVLFGQDQNSYWNLVTMNGRLVEMSKELHNELKVFCGRSSVKSCIVKGNICRILLTSFINKSVTVLELSCHGELLHKHQIVVEENPEGGQIDAISMNRRGRLI